MCRRKQQICGPCHRGLEEIDVGVVVEAAQRGTASITVGILQQHVAAEADQHPEGVRLSFQCRPVERISVGRVRRRSQRMRLQPEPLSGLRRAQERSSLEVLELETGMDHVSSPSVEGSRERVQDGHGPVGIVAVGVLLPPVPRVVAGGSRGRDQPVETADVLRRKSRCRHNPIERVRRHLLAKEKEGRSAPHGRRRLQGFARPEGLVRMEGAL